IDWTPDSKSIVFDGNRDPGAALQFAASQLYVIEVETGAIRNLVSKRGSWTTPLVSPDGKLVAFVGFEFSGRSYDVSDVHVISISGDNMKKITGNYDRDVINIRWAPDSSGVYFDAEDQGSQNVQFAPLNGAMRAITTGPHVLTFDSMSRDLIAVGT